MSPKFFATVIAPDRRALMRLSQYDLDLFQPTVKVTEEKTHTIEGLLTLEEIGRLVVDGYRVLVEEEASKRARAQREIVEFQDWIKGMEE